MLLYDSKFIKHPGKLQMHWLGLYLVHSITSSGVVKLQQLDGAVLPTLVNGSRLKPYRLRPIMRTTWGVVKKNEDFVLEQQGESRGRGYARLEFVSMVGQPLATAAGMWVGQIK